VSRRRRAVLFTFLAVGCAVTAAIVANGYGSGIARGFGPMRPVLVTIRDLPAGRVIGSRAAHRGLELRRVPERFAPPDVLSAVEDALGRAPVTRLPAGAYLTAGQLEMAGDGPAKRLAAGRQPVEIAVSGAGALSVSEQPPEGSLVDVVVTAEPASTGAGRTYVAAAAVELLALREGGLADADAAGPGGWLATLALTRNQALELIEAESFAREVRLLPRG
jgi:Flp pilus assembly protein CpaB